MQDKTYYRIADVATLVGVAAETLRQWEKHGLFTPSRSATGHRFYDASQVASARTIARYRMEEGLSLSDIRAAMAAPANFPLAPRNPKLSAAQATMPGQRLRRLRNARHISLSQLANDVAISASALSTFERTSQGLSVSVLRRIADHFAVTVTKLTVIPERVGKPVRRRRSSSTSSLGHGITVRALATGPWAMDCKEWTLKPGAQSDGSYCHDGEEFIYVLGGRLDITVEGMGQFRLDAGDSLYFESKRPHAWINQGETDCLVLWVNTPPSF